MTRFGICTLIVVLLACGSAGLCAAADGGAPSIPWDAVKSYEYGQDLKPLLIVERATYRSMADAAQKQAMAKQLLGIVCDSKATPAARQFCAIQLRRVASAAEVPALAKLLADPVAADWARQTLEDTPGKESVQALRESLPRLKGKVLVGAINSLGARKDAEAVSAMVSLANGDDSAAAESAIRALGKIGGPAVLEALAALRSKAKPEMAAVVDVAYLQAARALAAGGAGEKAAVIFQSFSTTENPPAIRRAAMQGLLSLEKDPTELVLQWLGGKDEDALRVAGGEIRVLTAPQQVKKLLEHLTKLPPAGRALLLQGLAQQHVSEALPAAVMAANDADTQLREAGVESLALIGQAEQVPLLIERLGDSNSLIANVARDSLRRISAAGVDEAILAGMKQVDDERRGTLATLLAQRRAAMAVPVLIEEAGRPDSKCFDEVVEALRDLCTPVDIPSLVKLLLALDKGSHRDEVEKTIMLVCDQVDDPQGRAGPILVTMEKLGPADRLTLLPLVGRIGGKKARAAVDAAIESPEEGVREAGIRALCNWPDASAADALLKLAKDSPNHAYRVWALRAYIRVVSLPCDRPDAETLAMLQQAMGLADGLAEKKLVLSRASAVRTVETLRWVAPYLDQPELAQEACRAVVELAHHRMLLYPNRAEFAPALKKVIGICKNRELVDKAKQYLQQQ